ncbi:unnamed protein product [Musa acuminata var. zebrina]
MRHADHDRFEVHRVQRQNLLYRFITQQMQLTQNLSKKCSCSSRYMYSEPAKKQSYHSNSYFDP